MEDKEREVTEIVTEENEEFLQDNENVELEEFTDTEEEKEPTSEEDVKEISEEKLYTKAEMDAEVERIAKLRETRAYKKSEMKAQKEIDKYKEIFDTLKVGMGKDNVDEISNSLKDFYKEQGIDIPEKSNSLSEKDETILAKAYAKEIIELGEDEINDVASSIYNKPLNQRTIRDKVLFNELGEYMMNKKAEDELKSKGINTEVLQDAEFKKFASKFSQSTALSEIYDMYSKLSGSKETEKKTPPASTGSVRNTAKTTDKYREDYTPEEVSKLTTKDLDDPKLMRAVEKSMEKWKTQ